MRYNSKVEKVEFILFYTPSCVSIGVFALFIGTVWRSSSETLRKSLYVYTNHLSPPKGPFKKIYSENCNFLPTLPRWHNVSYFASTAVPHQKVTINYECEKLRNFRPEKYLGLAFDMPKKSGSLGLL